MEERGWKGEKREGGEGGDGVVEIERMMGGGSKRKEERK